MLVRSRLVARTEIDNDNNDDKDTDMAEFTNEAWYTAKAIDASYGMIVKNGTEVPCASVVFQLPDGKTIKFEVTKWSAQNNVFTFRKLQTCGWKFVSPKTIREDILGAAKNGHTVRIKVRWVPWNDSGFWSVDQIMPNEQAARAVKPASDDTEALMQEMMRDARRADEEYRASRGETTTQSQSDSTGGDGPAAGDPCNDCGSPLFDHAAGYVTCANGHDVIPF